MVPIFCQFSHPNGNQLPKGNGHGFFTRKVSAFKNYEVALGEALSSKEVVRNKCKLEQRALTENVYFAPSRGEKNFEIISTSSSRNCFNQTVFVANDSFLLVAFFRTF